MDYKEKVELIGWHSLHTKVNGTDARVLMCFIAEANYKTGEVKFGLGDLVQKIGSDKNSISKSIKKLIDQEALIIVEKGNGTRPTNYRVSNLERLSFLFEDVARNPNQSKWERDSIELFGDIISARKKMENGRVKCQKCNDENSLLGEDDEPVICNDHLFEQQDFERTLAYKRYQLWLMDNPEPIYRVKTIKGVVSI